MPNISRILINDYAGHPFEVQLSRELAKRGYDVLHTYCASVQTPHGALVRKSEDPDTFNVQPIRLASEFDKYGLISRWRQEAQLGTAIIKTVRTHSPQVVISANTPLRAQSLLLDFCRSENIKFVAWVQDLLGIGIRKALRKKIPIAGDAIGLYFEHKERSILKRCDKAVVITEDFLPFMPHVLADEQRVSVVENWAPLDELAPMPKTNSWSEHHGLSDKFCFLYSGTLGLKHNPELLVELANHFRHRLDVRVVVVSEGPGAELVSKQKQEYQLSNLVVMAFQPYDLMPAVLAAGDVLVGLLEEDAGKFAVPSKVLTYLCAQRPLLLAVPLQNLAARIVSENKAGLVVPPLNTNDFLCAAQQLVVNQRLRNQYAANGRQYAERTFDIQAITDRFEEIVKHW